MNNHWLSKIDIDSISVILSFLPLEDQLQFRVASKSFNEMVMEGMTISKIVLDFINYWNKTIKQNDFTKMEELLNWTLGAQLRCNGFIRNQQILSKKEIKNSFTEDQLKLLQSGVIEVSEMISDKGLCDDTFFSFSKIKWNVNNNTVDNPKTITFIQNYLQCVYWKNLETLNTQYALKFYEDDNIHKTKPLILFDNFNENVVNREILEKVRNTYCNPLVTYNLEEFCNFLLKLANSPLITKPDEEYIGDFELHDNLSDNDEIENNYNEFFKKGVLQMNKFIHQYDWKEFVSIFCNSLNEINHQMKSIMLNNNLIKNSNTKRNDGHSSNEEEEEHCEKLDENNPVKLLIQSKLYKICDSKEENNFHFKWITTCEELKENREAIFYLSPLNKYIKVKAKKKVMILSERKNAVQLFYKELNENEWNCFYNEDNLHLEPNIKEIYYEKEKKRKSQRPKRPMTSYIFFCQEKREIIKQQHPEMKAVDLMKETAMLWKSLSDEEKLPYQEQAEVMKQKYKVELQEFEKRKIEEEENEEREWKREKLSVMDISKVKEMFELNVTDELFIEMLIKVMKACTLVVTDGGQFFHDNVQSTCEFSTQPVEYNFP
ncbi:hypothetical protein ABK040_008927 [Willaertia magna]